MIPYKDVDGDSNVEAYEIYPTAIAVKFNGPDKIYVYSYSSAGMSNVEQMKRLAQSGDGLNSYINTYCKYNYER